jgi:hypothetical protein
MKLRRSSIWGNIDFNFFNYPDKCVFRIQNILFRNINVYYENYLRRELEENEKA